ncbi:hypothetical protein ACWD04_29950 [Streptomyces sp. NPDC002911]
MLIKTECVRGRHEGRGEPGALRVHRRLPQQQGGSRSGWASSAPIEFEEKYYADQATAEQANPNTHQPALTS